MQLFERLALLGYSFDLVKWESFVNGGLITGLPPLPSNDCQIPHATEERIRIILDVERQLAPGSNVDKLAFYLVVAGLDDVPPRLVGDYIESSLSKFFVVGDGMLRRLERKPARVGPLAERKLANAMAKAVLRDYPLLSAPAYESCQQLLATCFIIFFRTSWSNRRPSPKRQWQRIITPDFLDYQRLPVKTIGQADQPADAATPTTMEPAADKERLFAQLRVACDTSPKELMQAVKDAAMVISAATTQFPELQEAAPLPTTKGAFAQWVLTLLPPVLSAALFRVSQNTRTEKYSNLIPDRRETGLEAISRTVLVYWHT
ncbi:MAG: hypothetical protein M3Z41_02475 [Candidatus Eremiobacteraeota bacterium]|nr:hypothetical protein [Candidatus Eremiobacteraeota bacterium]